MKKKEKREKKKKAEILVINHTPVHLQLSILELGKILINEFWYDYVKVKYDEKAKLCYMDTDSFIVYIKRDDVFIYNAGDVETRFDNTSNYKLDKPLPKGKNLKGNCADGR